MQAESWNTAKKTIENELGPLKNIFESVEPVPIAAASIAQVHSATLNDGSSVVIKIQRPKIQDQVTSDLKVMAWLAPKFVGRIPIAALTNPPALVELFAETICEELDFQLEVANLFELERALRGNSKNSWKFPVPNLDYVTSKIIVMSEIKGVSLGNANEMEMESEEVADVFRQMVDGLLEGAVIHGIFHGDFHAGNVFLEQGKGIGLVDFGITGRLNGERRTAFLRYVVGLMTGDVEAQISGLRDLGAFPSDSDIETLIKDFKLERDDFDPLEMSEEEFVEEIRLLVKDLLTHGARIPKELMLFVKNFAYLSSVIQNLSPEMDLLEEFENSSEWSFVGIEIEWTGFEKHYRDAGLAPGLPSTAWRTSTPLYNNNEQVGYATSGTWSPLLKRYIALAHVKSKYAKEGSELMFELKVEHFRKLTKATVVKTPFYDPERKRSCPQ